MGGKSAGGHGRAPSGKRSRRAAEGSRGHPMRPDRMQRERFELKYLLHETTAQGVRAFVQSHLRLDEAGVGHPDCSYRVNSLYLDSPHLDTFYDWVNANRNRFKLRIRFYDSHPDSPVFLEIKRRVSSCILKQRCKIRKAAAPLVLAGQFPPQDLIVTPDAKAMMALERFIALSTCLHAAPKALVTYRREAYVDPANAGVRLTFDRQVRITPRATCDFSLDLAPCTQPFGNQVILELKFSQRFPGWFNEMVRLFSLTRGAAAKYCEGMANLRHPELGTFRTRRWRGGFGSTAVRECQRVNSDPVPLLVHAEAPLPPESTPLESEASARSVASLPCGERS